MNYQSQSLYKRNVSNNPNLFSHLFSYLNFHLLHNNSLYYLYKRNLQIIQYKNHFLGPDLSHPKRKYQSTKIKTNSHSNKPNLIFCLKSQFMFTPKD